MRGCITPFTDLSPALSLYGLTFIISVSVPLRVLVKEKALGMPELLLLVYSVLEAKF